MTEQHQKEEKLPGKVYYVYSVKDNTVLIALDVTINHITKLVTWFDSIKERIMRYDQITRQDTQVFAFRRAKEEDGGDYAFYPMTLKIYNERVKKHLISPGEFTSEDDLIKAFQKTKEDAW